MTHGHLARRRTRQWIALAGGFLFFGAAAAVSANAYREVPVANGGRVRGVVRLSGAPPEAVVAPAAKDEAVCGKEPTLPRLVVGKAGGVANAVVWLEGIAAGKPWTNGHQVAVDQRGCSYQPHVAVVPVGANLEIVNSDPVLHNVHARTHEAPRTVFNISLPLVGQRTPVDGKRLDEPGLMALSCEAGHPWMSGYLMVAAHPYYAVTGEDGSFTLEGVPPGTYTLRMWHEGVKVASYAASLQRYTFEEPYEASKSITVGSGAEARADFTLTLR
ncbi:MAG TPA: carboxypeptidase regulatory-like domain-containing protein [Thermoanaerobaculia bacterium]|nr:carboxypeptidase regulatory-like domain-containing protein [Thermoanaerobaculia bacterium]